MWMAPFRLCLLQCDIPSNIFAGGLPCRSHWWPGSECDRKRGDGKPDLEDFRMCIVVFWSYKLPTNVEIMARQIQGSPIVLCLNRWRWDGDRGQVKRDPTLLSILSTNLMRVLLCQCTRRGKRLNHFCLDACTASFAKVNFGGIIKHHHLSGGETGEEALLRLLLPPWLVRSSFSTNNFCNNFYDISMLFSS